MFNNQFFTTLSFKKIFNLISITEKYCILKKSFYLLIYKN